MAIDCAKMLTLRAQGRSYQEIGDKYGITRQAVQQRLSRLFNVLGDEEAEERLTLYKEKQADIIDAVAAKYLSEALSEDRIKAMSAYQLIGSYGILFDKSRLARSQSTEIIEYSGMSKKEAEIEHELQKLRAMVLPGECETVLDEPIRTDETQDIVNDETAGTLE